MPIASLVVCILLVRSESGYRILVQGIFPINQILSNFDLKDQCFKQKVNKDEKFTGNFTDTDLLRDLLNALLH
ncbi:Hypothetical predicted protein [Mytilus galloprovincialis]|uniref:Uncharacterized protein n=1 Tax=Mytilus galloprovincialis TaxID=29158 RepID=A0A8B6DAS6_MYTGA|nr:Hypothetical predicted protein [Mytilus galloprovincialis]